MTTRTKGDTAAAAARTAQLRDLADQCRRRQSELVRMRRRATARKEELKRQRTRIDSDLRGRRAELLDPERRAAAALLEAAVRASGIASERLWLEYVAMGGSSSPSELASVLSGERPLFRLEHDRIAQVINEHLANAGFVNSLVAYWDGSR